MFTTKTLPNFQNVNFNMNTKQNKEIDNIYKQTLNDIMSEVDFPQCLDFENERAPTNEELNEMDLELENAIKLLTAGSGAVDNTQNRKYNEIDSFLEKYAVN